MRNFEVPILARLKITFTLLVQNIKESHFLVDTALCFVYILGQLSRLTNSEKTTFKYLSQVHRSTRSNRLRALAEAWIVKHLDIHNVSRNTNTSHASFAKNIGYRILVLKPKVTDIEPGVLLVKYSEMLPLIPQFMNMHTLLRDYKLVFEPSWAGYCTEDILHYAQYEAPIYILGREKEDNIFIGNLNSNLVPIDLGAGDWVDPRLAEPFLHSEKKFDIVMNANWGALKRHFVLFETLQKLEKTIRVALVGVEWNSKTKQDVVDLANYYGVLDQLEIFEKIPFEEVMKISCQSKLAILLSLKEGANKAIPEALFCDVPAIVLSRNVGGQVRNIVSETGILSTEKSLQKDIEYILNNRNQFSPRKWAIENISCLKSTVVLNDIIKQTALNRGEAWSRDIAVRTNSPDLGFYELELRSEYEEYGKNLSNYLL